ncbi:MAG: thioredoxin-dependent thiol peroxidase [Candidatus Aenigmarchaeota archaeon]|nr:thioredoxin-dependent thiol peroxidase [Candidatus Aenigmarchaeota archaeon]
MPVPKQGEKAPDFALPDQAGKTVRLKDFLGKQVVLYFYPKDDTPGCTKEACDFRDNLPKITASKAVVLGVSKDNAESHGKFAQKYRLNFTLLADVDGKVCDAYGVFGLKQFMGKSFMGIKRTTFVIDRHGKIAKVFEIVRPEGHAEQVLAALER